MPDIYQMLNIVSSHVIPVVVLLVFLLINMMYLPYVERKVLAHMQSRLGPMRTGWHGLLQPIADAVKFLMKEDVIPAKADKWVFKIAPLIVLAMAFGAMVVIPLWPLPGLPRTPQQRGAALCLEPEHRRARYPRICQRRRLRRDHGGLGIE